MASRMLDWTGCSMACKVFWENTSRPVISFFFSKVGTKRTVVKWFDIF